MAEDLPEDDVEPVDEAEAVDEKAHASSQASTEEEDQVRRTLADVYTFVRAAEINKTIASFTFDHYIDEAKRRIKEPSAIRTASNPSGTGTRPSQLESLTKLEEAFNQVYEKAKQMAEEVGAVFYQRPYF